MPVRLAHNEISRVSLVQISVLPTRPRTHGQARLVPLVLPTRAARLAKWVHRNEEPH